MGFTYMKISESKIKDDYYYSYAREMGVPFEKYRELYLRDELAKLRNPYAFAELEDDDALYNTEG